MTKELWLGEALRIDDYDLPRIGHKIGVGEDEIHAVLDVESRGKGFDSQGRVIMLFEPHIFWRELAPKDRPEAQRLGLAYPKWRRNYPKDSYPRLKAAMKINATAALKACSWGLGQIMGFNHKLAGYNSVQAMVKAFAKDEANQLEAMIDFIKNTGLADELKAHDWRGFARGYNGVSYAKNNYHNRLANAYAKWAKIKDTLWTPASAEKEEQLADKEAVSERSEFAFDDYDIKDRTIKVKETIVEKQKLPKVWLALGGLILALVSAIGGDSSDVATMLMEMIK